MKKQSLSHGILITVEGIDGCGKSIFARTLARALETQYPVLLTKEPGGCPLGINLRKLLGEPTETPGIDGTHIPPTHVCPKAEFLLFAADRAQHVYEVVQPALEKHILVISDRMADSSIVYQGFARGLDISVIKTVNQFALNNLEPDITFFLELDPRIARERIMTRKKNLSAIEKEHAEFMETVARGYQDLFHDKKRVKTLDATQSTETLVSQAQMWVQEWITHNNQ